MFDSMFFLFLFFFLRAKTSRHFSGAPVYISFSFCFLAFFFFSFFCNNNNYYLYFIEVGGRGGCFPKVSMLFEVE